MRPLGKFVVLPNIIALVLILSANSTARASAEVYEKVLPGTVWVKAIVDDGKVSQGSGALIDAKRRWVVTNYHVVDAQDQVRVFFPQFRQDAVVAERAHYIINEQKLAIPGRVIFRDKKRDLALIQLSELPEHAKVIKLADRSSKPGQNLHVIGNPSGPALWVYSSGTVRSVYNKSWTAKLTGGNMMYLDSRVVETQIPINPGDSGGPVVNADSELVAIVSSYNKVQRLVSTCIDISEVKSAMARAVKGETGDTTAGDIQSSGPLDSSGPLPPRRQAGPYLPDPPVSTGPQVNGSKN